MLKPLNVQQLRKETPPPVPWLAQGFAAEGAVTLLYGEPGTGKSLLALALAKGVAEAQEIFGVQCKKSQSVVIDAENGHSELHRRIVGMGLDKDIEVCEVSNFSLGVSLGEVEDYCMQNPATGLIVLDSLRTLWPEGDENDSMKVTQMLTSVSEMARNVQAGVILLHHMNKAGSFRGSGAMTAVPEIAIEIGKRRRDKIENRRMVRWEKCRMASPPNTKYIMYQSDNDGRVNIVPSWAPTEDELWPDS